MTYSGKIESLTDLDCITKAIQQDPVKMNGATQDAMQYFRGHESNNYKLIANISRKIEDAQRISAVEKNIFNELRCWSKILLVKKIFHEPSNTLGFHKNWYWLSQIQHAGIPTRLLDWTAESRVALFFAVRNEKFHNVDGDLWAFFAKDCFNIGSLNQEASDPLAITRDFFVNIPIHWNKNFESNVNQRRILGQQGKFFIRPYTNTFTPLEDDSNYQPLLRRYKIPSASKKSILESLYIENYTDCTIYKATSIRMKFMKSIIVKKHSL